jgi:hypothetical protein
MRMIIARIKKVYYYLIGIEWITSPIGETCSPVPIYIVEECHDKVSRNQS